MRMKSQQVFSVLMLCLLAFAFFALVADEAAAADKAVGADKGIATKQGVEQSLGNKQFDKDKMPGKLEAGLAVGSIIAMIAVVKWL